MTILHTSDWHVGKTLARRFGTLERITEESVPNPSVNLPSNTDSCS